jgi:hypothetical protein
MAGIDDFLADKPGDVVTPEMMETQPPVSEEGQQQATDTPATPPVTEQKETFFEPLNKRYGTSFKSDDEISEVFKSTARIAELDAKVKELEPLKAKEADFTAAQKEWQAEKAKLEADRNPLKFFKNKDAYVAHQLSMSYPDEQVPIIMKLMTSDLTRMDKVDLLANELLLKTPDIEGGLAGANEVLLSELGIDAETKPEEWDSLTKNKINIRATEARTRLQALKDSVEIPKVKTDEEIAQETVVKQEGLKKTWSPFLDRIEAMDKVNIPDPSDPTKVLETIDIPDSWRKSAREGLMETILASEIEPTDNALKALVIEREKDFIYESLPQIYTLWANKIKSEAIAERDKLLNNDTLPNDNTKPPEATQETGGGMGDFLKFN